MDSDYENLSHDEIIHNIVYTWSVDQISNFLASKMTKNYDIDSKNSGRKSALSVFVVEKNEYSSRDREVINLLLLYGADPLQYYYPGCSILCKMAMKKDADVFLQMLRRVENIDILLDFGDSECTPLHLAVLYQMKPAVEYLLRRGADINKSSTIVDCTPLHMASRMENTEITELLLENGSDIEAKDIWSCTPLLHAIKYNKIEQVKLLLRYKANLFVRGHLGRTILHILFSNEKQVNLELLKFILNLECDPNIAMDNEQTPLHVLVANGKIENRMECAELLIEYGANINKQDDTGNTVLHAVAECHLEPISFLKFLIRKGVDAGLMNENNETFLDILKLKNRERTLKLVKFMILQEIAGGIKLKRNISISINSDPEFTAYEKLCRKELETIITKITDKRIPSRILSDPSERIIAKLCKQDELRNFFAEFKEEEFSIYGSNVKSKFDEGLKRFEAEKAGFQFLSAHFALPSLVILRIMDFSTTETLQRFSVTKPSKIGKMFKEFQIQIGKLADIDSFFDCMICMKDILVKGDRSS